MNHRVLSVERDVKLYSLTHFVIVLLLDLCLCEMYASVCVCVYFTSHEH